MHTFVSLPWAKGNSSVPPPPMPPLLSPPPAAPRYHGQLGSQERTSIDLSSGCDNNKKRTRKSSATSIISSSTNSTFTSSHSFPLDAEAEHSEEQQQQVAREQSSTDLHQNGIARPRPRKRRKYSTLVPPNFYLKSNARPDDDDDNGETSSLYAGSFVTEPRSPRLYYAYSPAFIQSTSRDEFSSLFASSLRTPDERERGAFFLFDSEKAIGDCFGIVDGRMGGVAPEQQAGEALPTIPLEVPIKTSPPDVLHQIGILDLLALDPRPTFIVGAATSPPETPGVTDAPATTDIHDLQFEVVYHNDAFSQMMPDRMFDSEAECVKTSEQYGTSFVLSDPGMKDWVTTSFTPNQDHALKSNYVCVGLFLWSKTPVKVPGGQTWMLFSGILLPAAVGKSVKLVVGEFFKSAGHESSSSSISKDVVVPEVAMEDRKADVYMPQKVDLVVPTDNQDDVLAFHLNDAASVSKAPSAVEELEIVTEERGEPGGYSQFVVDHPVSPQATGLIHEVESDRDADQLISWPETMDETTDVTSPMEGMTPTTQPPLPPEEAVALELEMSTVYSPHLPSDFGFFDWTRLPASVVSSDHTDLIRKVDWAATSIGPMSDWPQSLRTMICIVLQSPNPSAMYWGSDFNIIYNEAYVPMIQTKHPGILGQPYPAAWSELWDEVKDSFHQAIKTGKPTMKDDDRLFMLRSGFLEEPFFSWSMVPIIGEDGTVCGLYNPCFDKTRRVIAERRMLTLREVGERAATARELKYFWQNILLGLETNPYDSPFAILYSAKDNDSTDSDASSTYASSLSGQRIFALEGSLGVPEGHHAAPPVLDLKNASEGFSVAFREALSVEGNIFLDREAGTLPEELMEGIEFRGFEEACRSAVVCPIHPNGDSVLGFLVLGINSRRPFDDDYRLFIQLLTRQLTSSVASTVLYEEEVKRGLRAARLAELDRDVLSEELALKTKEARQSELKFSRMAAFSPVGMFIADFHGKITYLNDMWYEISKHPREKDPSSWLESIDPRDQTNVEAKWTRVVQDKLKMTWEFRWNTPWATPSGGTSDRWVLLSCSPELDGDGMLLGIFGTMTNITDQKLAEAFQKKRVDEVVELKRQQDNFVDIASHEMRNPLSAILQCTDAVIASLEGFKLGSSGPDFLEEIESSIDVAQTISVCALHQKRVVDDILTMSKLDSQLLLITPVDVQPTAVVQQAFKIFEQESESSDIHMEFKVEDCYKDLNVDWVKLDPSRLLQVLINLLTNALKFLRQEKDRTVTVSVGASLTRPTEKDDVQFFPSARDTEDCTSSPEWGSLEEIYLSFSVIDSGRGLTEEQMSLLFQRFRQATPRTHVQYGGSGLGLFICRELVHLQAGEIGVQSQAGRGCVFSFYIKCRRSTKPEGEIAKLPSRNNSSNVTKRKLSQPASARPAVVKESKATPKSLCGAVTKPMAGYKVLIVEDNLVNQKVLQRQLANIGCTVYVANHGQEALDKIAQSRFWNGAKADALDLTVVLMDVEMPVMDGLTATKRIRELQKLGTMKYHVPIIAVTANARDEQIKMMYDAGMDEFVSKPFRIPELLPKIEGLLKRFRDMDMDTPTEEKDDVMEQ